VRGASLLLASVASTLLGLFLLNPGLMAVGFSSAVCLLVAYLVDARPQGPLGITAEREPDKRTVFKNEFVAVRVTVRNHGDKTFHYVELEDRLPRGIQVAEGDNTYRGSLGPHEELSFGYVVHCPLRGRFELGPVTARFWDDYRLFRRDFAVCSSVGVVVFPSLEDVRRMEALRRKRAMDVFLGFQRAKEKGLGYDFAGLREYLPSDEYRWIDWKATARTRAVQVREYESERQVSVTVLLDCGESMGGGPEGATKLDYAVRAAVLLAWIALARRDRVGLTLYSESVRVFLRPAGGRKRFYELLYPLSAASPSGESRLEGAVRYTLPRLKERSLLLIVSDLEEPERVLTGAAKLCKASGHEVLFISPFGPAFELSAMRLHAKQDRIMAEAAYEKLWVARVILTERLRQLGVPVVNGGPEDLLPLMLARYLKVKRTGVTRQALQL